MRGSFVTMCETCVKNIYLFTPTDHHLIRINFAVWDRDAASESKKFIFLEGGPVGAEDAWCGTLSNGG